MPSFGRSPGGSPAASASFGRRSGTNSLSPLRGGSSPSVRTKVVWQHDPLPRLPESLLELVASYLPQRDVLRCRLASTYHHAALPKTLRRLQLLFHHAGRVDWPAFASLEVLHIGLGGQGLVGTDEVHSLFPPPSSASGGSRSLFPHLKELTLQGLSLGDACMAPLWAGIIRLEQLHCLNLDGNGLTDASMDALADAMRVAGQGTGKGMSPFPHLTKLQLSSNQLGDAGVARLLRALADAKVGLQVLDLSDNQLGGQGTEDAAAAAAATDEEQEETASLVHVARALRETQAGSRLEELWMSYNHLTDASLRTFADRVLAQGRVPRLARLELESNGIGDAGIEALAGALLRLHHHRTSESSRLTTINLCKNEFGDEGARALAAVLAQGSCPVLARLDLSGNSIAGNGAVALALALVSGGTALRVLSLAWNNLADAGVVAFAAEVSKRRRQYVGGAEVEERKEEAAATKCEEVKDSDEEEEEDFEKDEEDDDDECSLAAPKEGEEGHSWLERLELSNNSIGDLGIQALATALQRAPPLARLQTIDLTGNDFHESGVKALAAIAAGGRYQRRRSGAAAASIFPDVRVYDGLLLNDLLGWTPTVRASTKRRNGRGGGGRGAGLAGLSGLSLQLRPEQDEGDKPRKGLFGAALDAVVYMLIKTFAM